MLEKNRVALLMGLLVILAPAVSRAEIVVITFDDGYHDPDIVSPGGELHGPFDWLEAGTRWMGFWVVDVGTVDGHFQLGHTHPSPNWSGQQDGIAQGLHSWTDDLIGLYISIEDGSRFSVVSIDYQIKQTATDNPDMDRYAWSFGEDDSQLLLATSFDPSLADVEGQWTAFDLPTIEWNPWFTRQISGFEDLPGVWLTSTAVQLTIDTIVLDVDRSTGATGAVAAASQVPLSPVAAMMLVPILAATGAAATRRWARAGASHSS